MDKIEWRAPEHIHTHKGPDWYWVVGIVAVSVAIIAIILNDPIFGLLILIAAFALCLHASRPPRIVSMKIDNTGVQSGDTLYPFDHLSSFWVETADAYPRVLVKSKKIFMPYITLLLDGANADEIREILKEHLPEEQHTELLLQKIFIRLGF